MNNTNTRTSSIRTIAVLSFGNHCPNHTPKNSSITSVLSDELKAGRYVVIPLEGNSGIAVLNISLEMAKTLSGRYRLASFHFLTNSGDDPANVSWEKKDMSQEYDKRNNPYMEKRSDVTTLNVDETGDWHAMIGGHNVTVPFSIIERIDWNLNRLLEENKISDKDKTISFTISGVGQSPYIWRGAIYNGLL